MNGTDEANGGWRVYNAQTNVIPSQVRLGITRRSGCLTLIVCHDRYGCGMNQPGVARIHRAIDLDVNVVGERATGDGHTGVIDREAVEVEARACHVQTANLVLQHHARAEHWYGLAVMMTFTLTAFGPLEFDPVGRQRAVTGERAVHLDEIAIFQTSWQDASSRAVDGHGLEFERGRSVILKSLDTQTWRMCI